MTNDWKPSTEAPRDGTVLLFSTREGSELMFCQWGISPWTKTECFVSLDEDRNWAIGTSDLKSWVFVVLKPPS